MENGRIPSVSAVNGSALESVVRMRQEVYIRKLRGKLKDLQTTMISDMQNKVDSMIDDAIKDIHHEDIHINEFKGLIGGQQEIWTNRLKVEQREKGRKLAEKIFTSRDSLFTCLYRVPHMNTIYHTFIVVLIVIVLNTVIQDFVSHGIINFGQTTIQNGMRGFWRGVGLWCGMQASVILVYYGLKSWAQVHWNVMKNESLLHIWDAGCLFLFVSFQLFFMCAASYGAIRLDLAFVTTCCVLLEMTRFVMKMHAFVRSNVPRILGGKLKLDAEESSSDQRIAYPSLSQFLYYMFSPTFLYRDQYPRTSKIDWKFAFCRLLEVVGVMFFMANIHERYIQPNFIDFGKVPITTSDLVAKLFRMVLPGFLIFLSGFYCILHAWLNFTGELLRFSDRMYYKDWWTAYNFDSFYRNWNVVVHDWLYEYIYKDMFTYVFRGSKTASGIMVFMISAAIHEFVLAIGLRFFFPVLLMSFGFISVIFVFLTRKINKTVGNIFLWLTLSTGNGIVVSLYALEYYARQNCPDTTNVSWSSYFVPVSLRCNGLQ